MMKKLLVAAAAVLAVLALPMAAGAQDGVDCTTDPTNVVSPACVGSETEEPPAEEPSAAPQTPQPAAVAGAQTRRPLPATGTDIGPTALLGLALTGTGIALALGARRRRLGVETV